MLVLSRKAGEKIKIGKDIVINILKIEGGIIRVGIDAPQRIPIFRMEVFEKIQNENIESVSRKTDEITDAIELIKNKLPKERVD